MKRIECVALAAFILTLVAGITLVDENADLVAKGPEESTEVEPPLAAEAVRFHAAKALRSAAPEESLWRLLALIEEQPEACREAIDEIERTMAAFESQDLARAVLRLDDSREAALKVLGHMQYRGAWYGPEEREFVQIAMEKEKQQERFSRMSVREQRVCMIRHDFEGKWDSRQFWSEPGPDSAYLVCVERTDAVAAQELADSTGKLLAQVSQSWRELVDHVEGVAKPHPDEIRFYILFQDEERYRRFGGSLRGGRGHLDLHSGIACIVADAPDRDAELAFLAIYRLAHDAARNRKGNRPWNMFWLPRGLAEYFSHHVIGSDGAYRPGAVPEGDVATLQDLVLSENLLPLRQLLPMTELDYEHRAAHRQAGLSVQAWALVHFLLHGQAGALRGKFTACLSAFATGDDAKWRELIRDLTGMEAEFQQYIRDLKP